MDEASERGKGMGKNEVKDKGKGVAKGTGKGNVKGVATGVARGAAAQVLSRAESTMRATLEALLALPRDERERLEAAESYAFTLGRPAPTMRPEASERSPMQSGVLDDGSVEAAALLARAGYNPVLLNFAHGYNCGGGFEHASGSQEEDIFRKTSAVLSLWPHRRSDDGPGVLKRGMWIGDFDERLPRKEPFYPHSECGAIYSPEVRMVDGSASFALLSAAAQDCHRGRFDRKLLREKIRSILHVCLINNHDCVVLGAFGCGYFLNPEAVVAEEFAAALGGEFLGSFGRVVFAVPIKFGRRTHNTFAERFGTLRPSDLGVAPGEGAP